MVLSTYATLVSHSGHSETLVNGRAIADETQWCQPALSRTHLHFRCTNTTSSNLSTLFH